jgi:hypothetical protein
MRYKEKYLHCGDYLRGSLEQQISEIALCIGRVTWNEEFSRDTEDGRALLHQRAYNLAFQQEFLSLGWESQPRLLSRPRLIGDFRKDLVFVEIQFGNSATLYRDYYKFQYGLANGLLSLAVLVVPTNPQAFFPTRPRSVSNMAEFDLADRELTVLPIRVPVLLIGLLPEN